ncbi:MAG: hypothetical protein D6679_11745 [Candidatus Hydrogenedentota bacterium]|nr:MAG: hypothetical protein D6679_11745 [Candidatus Hydrogenedentota bacterium]
MEKKIFLSKRGVVVFLLLILLGTVLRVELIRMYPQRIIRSDAEQYLRLAENLSRGYGYSLGAHFPFTPDVYRSPGYPLFLATVLRLGGGPRAVLGFQIFLDLLSITFLAGTVARRWGEGAALWGTGFALLMPYTASISGLFLSEALAMPLANLLFGLGISFTFRGKWLLAGLIAGVLGLTRGVFLPVIPVVAAAAFWVGLRERTGFFGAAGRAGAVFMIGFVILLPYGLWNHFSNGRFSVVPLAGFGRALYGGIRQMNLDHPPLSERAWRIHNALWTGRGSYPANDELLKADEEMRRVAVSAIRKAPFRYLAGVVRQEIHIWFGQRFLFPFSNPHWPGWVFRWPSVFLLALGAGGVRVSRLSAPEVLVALSPVIVSALCLPWLYVNMRYTSLHLEVFGIAGGILADKLFGRK